MGRRCPHPTSLRHTCGDAERLGEAKPSWCHNHLVLGSWLSSSIPVPLGAGGRGWMRPSPRGSWWACVGDKRVSNGVPLPTSKPGRWTCQTQIMALRQHAVPCLGGLSEDRDHSKCDFVEPCPLSLCLFSLLLLPPDLFGSALSPDSPWQLIS